MDPYGLRRVVSPRGVLPQRADALDPSLPLGEDELSISVEALNVDAASLRQLEEAVGRDPSRLGAEVLRLVAEGWSNTAIAAELFVTVGTVKSHVHAITGKLGAANRVEAVAIARRHHLVE